MPSLSNMLERSSQLETRSREHIHHLVGDWQLISDFSFADLILAVPEREGRFIIVAACRPATNSTALDNDVVNLVFDPETSKFFHRIMETGKTDTTKIQALRYDGYPVRCPEGGVIAVMCAVYSQRSRKETVLRHPSYQEIEDLLFGMVTTGEFPLEGTPGGLRHGVPRVTDGFTHIDAEGAVLFSSPNAVSNFHRLGIRATFEGQLLAERITSSIGATTVLDDALPVVLMGRASCVTELELHGAVISLRSVPLTKDGKRQGAVILSRDITEIWRRELELVSKDAIIREINHRVKNNLQTVSALLRMQARRTKDKVAIEVISEAQRRVETIAVVHQILSESIDENLEFSKVISIIVSMATDIATTGANVQSSIEGDFGKMGADVATRLAMVVNELVSNAVEHGVPHGGNVWVKAHREGNILRMSVEDNGVGFPDSNTTSGLGTKIIHTLVEGELHGQISWSKREEGGTRVDIVIDLNYYDDTND
ncbi:histidine kinase N-terminal domain-containing protein [Actinotignum urinale]|uniref:sensor histidine kinase n=1 Tax=Actinotignum urinale TaxID=190146 RepID=UPI002A8000C3|nr:histidine kinase N-terminal domain-containing protein [Actinotignum urinale]MDY5129677.1 histidine kinase N-terminal domain-containing protein [Actinotignum urinale]